MTGLATCKADNQKVLMTALYVMTGPLDPPSNSDDAQEMNQEPGPAPWHDSFVNFVPPTSARVSRLFDWDASLDPAICELDPQVLYGADDGVGFYLHRSDHDTAALRVASAGVVEPCETMEVLYLDAVGGEGTVRVKDVGETRTMPDGITHSGVTVLDLGTHPGQHGDSGAPVLRYDENTGEYRMVCVVFGGVGNEAFAIPASLAECMLGITFGNRAPIAVASASSTALPGATVTLDGRGSSDPDSGTLTYQWRQVPTRIGVRISSLAMPPLLCPLS